MKRAKIILTGIALLAIFSAAAAFKATRTPQILYFNDALRRCSITTILPLTTRPQFPGQPASTITTLYSTAPTTASCPLTTWYSIE
ncbi:MAG TPA: hypothetical protein VN040_13415 [Pseudosphingobacterium sp.]|nr:hypothetical protein [Pseudosphingobacterium sp.]